MTTIENIVARAQVNQSRVLRETSIAVDEIKEFIKKTTLKTAEFIASVLAQAGEGEDDGKLRNANGVVLMHKSIKSPKGLIEFWEKHGLPIGALKRAVKATWAAAPQKVEKVKAPKPPKAKAEKPAKPAKTGTGKPRGRPRKVAAQVLQIADYRQGDLNLEVIAA